MMVCDRFLVLAGGAWRFLVLAGVCGRFLCGGVEGS